MERGDGWLELELDEFFNEGGEDGKLEIWIFRFNGHWKSGVIIEGIEIRPNEQDMTRFSSTLRILCAGQIASVRL
ncbi:hypothetical protein SLA2020_033550 [Shorea laevis]